MTFRFAFATWSTLPTGQPDDLLAAAVLAKRGHSTTAEVWDDPNVDWGSYDAVVIRSTWDYYQRPSEFLGWLDRCSRATALWNPAPMARWNSHKSYLLELARAGVPVIPTEQGQVGESLDELCRRGGWEAVVVKRMVAAAAYSAHFVPPEERAAFEPLYSSELAAAEIMVQPFIQGVLDPGERSLVYLDGQFNHAFSKGAALPVDRRDVHGYRGVDATPAERALGDLVLTRVDPTPLYARVDLVKGPDGAPLLMELELLEPHLFFAGSVPARARFADALLARM